MVGASGGQLTREGKDMPRKAKKKRVALIIIGHAAVPRAMALGICQYCKDNTPWDIVLETSTDPFARERLMNLVKKGVDGVIGDLSPNDTAFLVSAKVPTVDLGPMSDTPFPTVHVDFRAIGRITARHLLERRIRHFGCCSDKNFAGEQRLEGFESELNAAGFRCSCLWLPRDWPTQPDALGNVSREWLKSLPKPVGVMANGDMPALGVIWTCAQIGLRVPQDVAVVGCDNDELFCGISPVPISTVAYPAREIGYKAAGILDRMMRGGRRPSNEILVEPTQLIVRASSDSYAISDPQVASALQYIRDHAGDPLLVSDVAAGASLVRRTMERQFIKIMGHSPRQEILNAHIERAKLLLAETRLKIPVVSARAGFPRHQVFFPLFKKVTGLTPGEYRQKYWHGS